MGPDDENPLEVSVGELRTSEDAILRNPDYRDSLDNLALEFGGYAFKSIVNKNSTELKIIANENNIKIIFLHAKEIIQRLGDGTLDIGISGLDLLKESEKNLQEKISIKQKLSLIHI